MSSVAEQLAEGWRLQQAGRPADAERLYRDALLLDTTQADLWAALGSALMAQGKAEDAAAAYAEAVRRRPSEPRFHNNRANALTQLGRPADAVPHYREALRLRPDYALALANLGNALAELERFDEAISALQEAIRLRPDLAAAHNNLGFALLQQRRAADALAPLTEAVRLTPNYADALVNLGLARLELGAPDEALALYERAVRANPSAARPRNNLGCLLAQMSRLDEAVAHLRQALALQPRYAEAANNLGTVFAKQGRLGDAADTFRQALAWKPGYAAAHLNLGGVLWDRTRLDEAEEQFREAIRRQPTLAAAQGRLGHALADRGFLDDAARHYREASRLDPTPHRRLAAALVLPPILRSVAEKQEVRERLSDNLRQLHEDGVRVDVTHEAPPTLFYLAYHGLNDRPLLESFGRLLVVPPFEERKRSQSVRLRVAFVSRYLRGHTVGELLCRWIGGLPRADFEVSVFVLGRADDEVTQYLRTTVEHYAELPFDLPTARAALRAAEPDVLFYADIGMDPLTSALAASRWAPLQCVTWGHPSTSGLATVDSFVSSDLFEPADGDSHYTEKLERLPALPFVFVPPELTRSQKSRTDLGLPEDAHIYASPQSLFKFQPEFDALLGDILRADPKGLVVLNQAHHPYYRLWEELLRERWRRAIPDVAERIVFLPRLSHDDYLRLNELSDVLLDPPHFNGGHTTLKALSLGVPVVTRAGGMLKSRMTLAMYRTMGMTECIAATDEEYVALAVRLATDRDYGQYVRKKIVDGRETLCDGRGAVEALAAFLGRKCRREGR